MKKYTTIKKLKIIHNGFYEYDFIDNITKCSDILSIVCPIHGNFNQDACSHKRGRGCSLCGKEKTRNSHVKSREKFIEESIIKHKNKYDYSKVAYMNARTKVKIVCPQHGVFLLTPDKHLGRGDGCRKCGEEYLSNLFKKTNDQFIKDAKKCHGKKYDYSLAKYISKDKKVKIICKHHGIFLQSPHAHTNGSGCPRCMYKAEESIGKIIESLYKNKIARRKRLNHPVYFNGRKVRSFMIPDYLMTINGNKYIIEYHGQQHTKPTRFGGVSQQEAEYNLQIQKRRDDELRIYCKNNNIKLLEIYHYDINKKDIKKTISNFLFGY